MSNVLYISYHDSKPIYMACGQQLMESIENVGITDYYIERVSGTSWDFGQACAYKPAFVLRCLEEYQEYDRVIYLDSDSVVMEYPYLFENIPDAYDIGVHYREGQELLGGAIYLKNHLVTRDLVADWEYRCREDLRTWDQRHLQNILESRPDINVYHLPPEYCQIFDLIHHLHLYIYNQNLQS